MRQNFEHELVRRPAQIQEKREIDRTYLFMRSMAKSCQFSLMYHEYLTSAFGSVVENPPADTGEAGLIPESGRSPEEGNGNPLQYSCLANPIDRGACRAIVHGAQKSQT